MSKELEEGDVLQLDFNKLEKAVGQSKGIIPVAVQHADTGEVILVAYTNELAFRRSVESKSLVLWSTSRNELWEKGKTSGETFDLVEARVNCEQNSLLYVVRPAPGRDLPHEEQERPAAQLLLPAGEPGDAEAGESGPLRSA